MIYNNHMENMIKNIKVTSLNYKLRAVKKAVINNLATLFSIQIAFEGKDRQSQEKRFNTTSSKQAHRAYLLFYPLLNSSKNKDVIFETMMNSDIISIPLANNFVELIYSQNNWYKGLDEKEDIVSYLDSLSKLLRLNSWIVSIIDDIYEYGVSYFLDAYNDDTDFIKITELKEKNIKTLSTQVAELLIPRRDDSDENLKLKQDIVKTLHNLIK